MSNITYMYEPAIQLKIDELKLYMSRIADNYKNRQENRQCHLPDEEVMDLQQRFLAAINEPSKELANIYINSKPIAVNVDGAIYTINYN